MSVYILVASALVFIVVFYELPISVELIILVVNFFTPDPVPYIDEIMMIAIMAKKFLSSRGRNGAKEKA